MNLGKEISYIKISDIIPNRFQPRLTFDENELNELVASIKLHGIIQPLVLRQIGDKYEIIAGERRYKAAVKAGLTEVPAIITVLNDKESAEIAVVENIQRKSLSAIEEAKSYKKLLDLGQLTQDQLALRMGKSQSNVANKLRLLSLDGEVQNALLVNKISERHARSLLQLKDLNKQKEILNRIINERLTVKQTDDIIKDYLNNINNYNEEKKEEIKMVSEKEVTPINNINKVNDEQVNIINPTPSINPNLSDNNVINLDLLNGDNISNMEINDNIQNALKNLDIVDTKSDVFNDTEPVVEDKTQVLDINKIKEVAQDINKPKDLPNFDDLLKSDLPKNEDNTNNKNPIFNLNDNKFVPSFSESTTIDSSNSLNNEAKIVDNPLFNNQSNDELNNIIKPLEISTIEPSDEINNIPLVQKFDLPKLEPINTNQQFRSTNSINQAVNILRDSVKKIEDLNYDVDCEELDLPGEYQFIIKIIQKDWYLSLFFLYLMYLK